MLQRANILKRSILRAVGDRYRSHQIPPLPLNVKETTELCNILKYRGYYNYDEGFFMEQFKTRIVPGVDETTLIKANFLKEICFNNINCNISDKEAIKILGTMQGGYNVSVLTELLECEKLAKYATNQLKKQILVFEHVNIIGEKFKKGNIYAKEVLESWSEKMWFYNNFPLKDKINLTIFKVNREINTDDLSPAQDAWSRPDIPLHSQSMLKFPREDIVPDIEYEVGPMKLIEKLKQKRVAFAGDIVGTGSSRKSATNSLIWHFGDSIKYVPNVKQGGFCFGGKIAPIFFNTMEDSGALPIELDVTKLHMEQDIILWPYEKIITDNHENIITNFDYKTTDLLENVRAGGRIKKLIGNKLTLRAREILDYDKSYISLNNDKSKSKKPGYTLAQKIVGKACQKEGILPNTYCEPIVTSVGSQDTTGPMTRDELKSLACLGFSADLVMQSFCHTSAYPKPVDIITHKTLPKFMSNLGGISLKPGDGIIHSWLNRMILPDTVGTGGDSHTRFPIGISFPAGSGLVAFAAATGSMPLQMPESVLVKFVGKKQPFITYRDLVHSIPYVAIQNNLLNTEKKNKINVFNGRILEIQGLTDLNCLEAFEFSDASAERSSSGCTIELTTTQVCKYLHENINLLNYMIKEGYQDKNAIQRRIDKMEEWLKSPKLLKADIDAEYYETLTIDLNTITEPILCAPNDPDKAVLLSEVAGNEIQEVFIGSCMTNITHFKKAGEILKNINKPLKSKLWMAPPTNLDEQQLKDENYYDIFKEKNVQLETPGCSLCMGNQARVEDNATVLSTSTRNFPNRLGKNSNVYLASAELSVITAIEGKIPDIDTYKNYMRVFHL